jgi:deoxyribodipyrimidine photo-lyase
VSVPAQRVRDVNTAPVEIDRDHVLYWMVAARRARSNFALERATEWAVRLRKPLLVFEPLRAGYPWASDRLHAFILQGMADNERAFAEWGVGYYPYVEPEPGAGRGLLAALARRAAVVVTDDFPAFFLRRMIAAAADQIDVRLEAVDSNGLVPLSATPKAFPSAYVFRLHLQKTLREHLAAFPAANPLVGADLPRFEALPPDIVTRWPRAAGDLLAARPEALAGLPIDHEVAVSPLAGGAEEAGRVLERFLAQRLYRYRDERAQPDAAVASGLSPYLHFGHISVHEVFDAIMSRELWTTRALGARASGQRDGWWGTSPAAESFLDELITWRELGYNMCQHRDDYDRYESLPGWAQATLDKHADDPRPHVYTLDELADARTHDRLWNAAQRQLRVEGRLQNYLRMLWGKKILEWSSSPRDALATMIELNNRYALDGRDPNSYSGIFWVLGRYDRPWAPERPIFGSIRYMSSENTARKLRVKAYLARYGDSTPA